jgi:hypothetical protein
MYSYLDACLMNQFHQKELGPFPFDVEYQPARRVYPYLIDHLRAKDWPPTRNM